MYMYYTTYIYMYMYYTITTVDICVSSSAAWIAAETALNIIVISMRLLYQ
jgi:hypothetical protein